MDYYLDDDNATARLIAEWRKYDRPVVAYDYDNTVYDCHGAGLTFDNVVQLLRDCRRLGAFLVVFTACAESLYPAIAADLQARDIPFDGINENPAFVPMTSARKIYYNILLDDRAGLGSAYRCLRAAVETIQRGE